MLKITTEDYEILDSGSIITFNDESVIFHFAENLRVKFSFEDAVADEPITSIKLGINDNIELEIRCFNMENTLGTSNSSPLKVGTFNGKELSLNFVISSIRANTKQIQYSFYLK